MDVTARTPRLVMTPAVHGQARPNFERSVRTGVSPLSFARLGPEQRALTDRHTRDGLVRMWGSRANKDSVWDAVRAGDVLLFYVKEGFAVAATVGGKVQDEDIANAVWEPVPDTWRNVLFLRQVWSLDLSSAFVGALLNYKPGWNPREFYIPVLEAQQHALAPYDSVDALIAALTGESMLGTDGGSYVETLSQVESGKDVRRILARLKARAGNHIPETATGTVKRIKRDAALVLELKNLYDGHCQVCDDTFATLSGHNYSEAAHIVPLERRLPGIDSYLNIVILCATCHRKLDHGGMTITWDAVGGQVVVGWQGRMVPLLKNKHINTGWRPAG
jgi:HNH endonuclease